VVDDSHLVGFCVAHFDARGMFESTSFHGVNIHFPRVNHFLQKNAVRFASESRAGLPKSLFFAQIRIVIFDNAKACASLHKTEINKQFII
jgi:hypothetical protein